jgi:hypothetical protein
MSDQQPNKGKPNRDIDPIARRPRNWVDIKMVVILGAIAVLMAAAVLTSRTYSLLLNTVPTISTAAPATTGETDVGPHQPHSGQQRSIERYPATLRARERPGFTRTP